MFDPKGDFLQIIDGCLAVTVLRPGLPEATVLHAHRQPMRTPARDRVRQATAADVAWHLPVAELPEAPKPGDTIVDPEGGRWRILSSRASGCQGRWICATRNVALAYGLSDRVDFEAAVYTKSPSGVDVPSWSVWRAQVAARIRPAESRFEEEHQNQAMAGRLTILIADDLPLDVTHRIKGPDGTIYRILRCRRPQPPGMPMEVDVERADGP